jgi:phage shock protein E
MIDNNTVLIDVRTKDEFKSGHLEKAINIPYTEIEDQIKSITKDTNKNIVVYCRSGRRSGIAQKTLLKMGYENVINGGGYKDLLKQQAQ